MHGGLKTHLLEGRAIGFNSHAVERFVRAFKRHVVGYEGQVPVVNLDTVHLENITYLLETNMYITVVPLRFSRVLIELVI